MSLQSNATARGRWLQLQFLTTLPDFTMVTETLRMHQERLQKKKVIICFLLSPPSPETGERRLCIPNGTPVHAYILGWSQISRRGNNFVVRRSSGVEIHDKIFQGGIKYSRGFKKIFFIFFFYYHFWNISQARVVFLGAAGIFLCCQVGSVSGLIMMAVCSESVFSGSTLSICEDDSGK